MTGTAIERATRSAVRWRVPVSLVGTFGFGTRCTFARAMRLASAARMIAPSIFASSLKRCGLNAASSRNPPEQMLSTSGPSPTTTSAPMPACRIRSSPSRSGMPGATAASASSMLTLRRGDIVTSLRDEAGLLDGLTHRGDAHERDAVRPFRRRLRDDGAAEPEPRRLGQPPRRLRHLAQLTAEPDLAAGDEISADGAIAARRLQRQRDGE